MAKRKIHPVRKIRLDLKLSQRDFAKKIKISQAKLSNIENCIVDMGLPELVKISKKFKVDMDMLLHEVVKFKG